jgi:hypothetical protein
MFDLKKFFVRGVAALHRDRDPDSDYHPSSKSSEGLQVEYQGLIASQFRRWGISDTCTTIEVRKLGQAPDGYDVFVGLVRLAHWERESALRVLIGLPLLEAKVRKTLRGTWLADFSHFAGLWLHSSEEIHHATELHDLLGKLAPLTPSSSGATTQGSGAYGSSSLPPSSQVRSEPDEEVPVSS